MDILTTKRHGNPKGMSSAIANENGSKTRKITKIIHCLSKPQWII